MLLVVVALWAVMTRSLIRAAIGLAMASAIVTILMFRLNSPLAAVFELSVCAGLIPVIFISSISLTQPLTQQEKLTHMRARFSRFWYLPLLMLVAVIVIANLNKNIGVRLPLPEKAEDVRFVLWHLRPLDIVGQIAMLLTGVFGIVVLFKEKK